MARLCCFFLLSIIFFLGSCVEGEKLCEFSHEIVLLQDSTGSYELSLQNLQNAMEGLFDVFSRDYPGIKFGVVGFKDSPVCGYLNDFCAHVYQSLSDPGASDMSSVRAALKDVYVGGGKDGPESFVDSIIRVALSSETGWSRGATDENGNEIVRIIIATTDNFSHLKGDGDVCRKDNSEAMVAGWGYDAEARLTGMQKELDHDINAGCGKMDYATWEDVKTALEARNIKLILLMGTLGGERNTEDHAALIAHGFPKGVFDPELASILATPTTLLARFSAEYILPRVGLNDAIVFSIAEDMTDFVEVLLKALKKLQHQICRTSTAIPDKNEPSLSTASLSDEAESSSLSSTVEFTTTGESSSSGGTTTYADSTLAENQVAPATSSDAAAVTVRSTGSSAADGKATVVPNSALTTALHSTTTTPISISSTFTPLRDNPTVLETIASSVVASSGGLVSYSTASTWTALTPRNTPSATTTAQSTTPTITTIATLVLTTTVSTVATTTSSEITSPSALKSSATKGTSPSTFLSTSAYLSRFSVLEASTSSPTGYGSISRTTVAITSPLTENSGAEGSPATVAPTPIAESDQGISSSNNDTSRGTTSFQTTTTSPMAAESSSSTTEDATAPLGAIIGGAVGGAAALAAVGVAAAAKMGVLFGGSSTSTLNFDAVPDAEVPENVVEREAFEPVQGELFS